KDRDRRPLKRRFPPFGSMAAAACRKEHNDTRRKAMERIWVIAADNARARLFQAEHITGPLHEVRDLVNPEARLQERELVSDSKGSTWGMGGGDNAGPARRQKFEPPSEKEHQSQMFAREVIEEVDKLRARGELERLHVIAEPGFLGRLRACYTPQLQKCLGEEVGRRATQRPPREIRELLPYRM